MIKKFFWVLFCVLVGAQSAQADSHLVDINVDESFKTAVKLVENKQYIDAVNIFNVLAEQEIPEAQFNLSLMLFNGLGAPKTLGNHWFGLGRLI